MRDPQAEDGLVHYLPAHPHEGAVMAPADMPSARVIALGISQASGEQFNIAVAFEPGANGGPAIAQSTFHHFCDYNWDPALGSPDSSAKRRVMVSRARPAHCDRLSATQATWPYGWQVAWMSLRRDAGPVRLMPSVYIF